jgi:hypothetical protein
LSRRVVVSGLALASALAAVVLTVELQHQPTSGSPAEVIGTGCTLPPGQNCYSLQAFRTAYGISPLLRRGIDGRGRTVVLVEWLASGAPPASDFAFPIGEAKHLGSPSMTAWRPSPREKASEPLLRWQPRSAQT